MQPSLASHWNALWTTLLRVLPWRGYVIAFCARNKPRVTCVQANVTGAARVYTDYYGRSFAGEVTGQPVGSSISVASAAQLLTAINDGFTYIRLTSHIDLQATSQDAAGNGPLAAIQLTPGAADRNLAIWVRSRLVIVM